VAFFCLFNAFLFISGQRFCNSLRCINICEYSLLSFNMCKSALINYLFFYSYLIFFFPLLYALLNFPILSTLFLQGGIGLLIENGPSNCPRNDGIFPCHKTRIICKAPEKLKYTSSRMFQNQSRTRFNQKPVFESPILRTTHDKSYRVNRALHHRHNMQSRFLSFHFHSCRDS